MCRGDCWEKGKGKSCLEFKSVSGALTVSAVMGRLMAFGPIYLGFWGPSLKAVTDMEKKHLTEEISVLCPFLFSHLKYNVHFYFSFEFQEFEMVPFFYGLQM